MTKKTVLVTGASGFLGRPLVGRLLGAGYSVRVTTHSGAPFQDSVDVVVTPNLKNAIDWKPILSDVNVVIHLAGLTHPDSRGIAYEQFDTINRIATENLAVASRQAGVERFVFVSSVRAQTGACAKHTVRETDAACPTDSYGRSKLATEAALRASGVPFTILRPVAVYGPHPIRRMRALVRVASTPFPLPFRRLSGRRSLLSIDNLISSILFLLGNPATVNETYLLADPTTFTVSEIVTMLREAQGRSAMLFPIPPIIFHFIFGLVNRQDILARLNQDLIADAGKLQATGWSHPINTQEGIVAMMRAELSLRDSQ
jgi:nucleoside-diphosphate-sugar epimerase